MPSEKQREMAFRGLLIVICMLAVVLLNRSEVLAADEDMLKECILIEDDAVRLRCYDQKFGRPEKPVSAPDNISAAPVHEKGGNGSYLTRLWELDEENRHGKYALKTHRSNYILPFTYNTSPNVEQVREDDPDRDLKKEEVAYQLSVKVKLWQDVLGKDLDLWFAYTQRSFWQLYNTAESSPFRETDYEPELLLNYRTDYRFAGFDVRYINIGLNHQSNGKSEPLSRSWNRVVANAGFERDNLVLLLGAWYRIPESSSDDDNPDIDAYLGYGEAQLFYFLGGHRFGLKLRNNLRLGDNRGSLQVDWSFPLIHRISGYVQYFNGYGESLLDYSHSVNRIGFGFIVRDWD
ncbi:MAG: phospholipase A [Syntrophaceae bacterium]|nr:phospholipase A [Syntrophaceae bacterium]